MSLPEKLDSSHFPKLIDTLFLPRPLEVMDANCPRCLPKNMANQTNRSLFQQIPSFTVLAGDPTIRELCSKLLQTTEQQPITESSFTVEPLRIVTFCAIQT